MVSKTFAVFGVFLMAFSVPSSTGYRINNVKKDAMKETMRLQSHTGRQGSNQTASVVHSDAVARLDDDAGSNKTALAVVDIVERLEDEALALTSDIVAQFENDTGSNKTALALTSDSVERPEEPADSSGTSSLLGFGPHGVQNHNTDLYAVEKAGTGLAVIFVLIHLMAWCFRSDVAPKEKTFMRFPGRPDDAAPAEEVVDYGSIVRDGCLTFVPTTVVRVLVSSNAAVMMMMMGHAGASSYVSATGLETGIWNICIQGAGIGIVGVLNTLLSQAMATGNLELALLYLQQGRAISTVFMLMIAPFLWYSEALLVKAGQDPEVARLTSIMLRGLIVGGWIYLQAMLTMAYLKTRRRALALFWTLAMSSLVSLVLMLVFVVYLRMGVVGMVCAKISAKATMYLVSAFAFAFNTEETEHCDLLSLLLFKPRVLTKGIATYLSLAVPSGLSVTAPPLFNACMMIFAGNMGPYQLAAQAVVNSLIQVINDLALGVSEGVNILIGQAIGAQQPRRVRAIIYCAFALMLGVWAIAGPSIYFSRWALARMYSRHVEIQMIAAPLIGFTAISSIVYLFAGVTSAAIAGVGLQKLMALSSYLYFVFLGIPCGWFLTLQAGWGVWGGALTTVAANVLMSGTMAIITFTLDTRQKAQETVARMKTDQTVLSTVNM